MKQDPWALPPLMVKEAALRARMFQLTGEACLRRATERIFGVGQEPEYWNKLYLERRRVIDELEQAQQALRVN